ncbi:MAG TPA: putative metal-binding motif-containing protein [Anaeromyxobacter sp.]
MNLRQIVAAVGVFAAMGFAPVAEARSTYLSTFDGKYGTTGTKLDSCDTCHVPGGKTRNPYGLDVEAGILAGKSVDASLTAIEAIDSDGDTFKNIDEIVARTFPGDASDKPGITPPPPPPTCADADADGYSVCDGTCTLRTGKVCGDCNDANAAINPGVTEVCTDGIDNNCDGLIDAADPVCAPVGLSDFDIASVRATGSVSVGRKASFKVNVVQVVPGAASLTVQVTEAGLTTTLGTVSPLTAGTFSFSYVPTIKGGSLNWSATIADQDPDADVATAVTVVK